MRTCNVIFLLLAVYLMILAGCKNDRSAEESNDYGSSADSKPELSTPQSGSVTGDTLNLSGKFVVFFGPGDSVSASGSITAGEIADFRATATAITDTLISSRGIQSMYTDAGVFRIYSPNGGVMIFSKKALRTEFGLLMTDGNQPPTIKKGTLSPTDCSELIRKYFFIN